MSGVITLRQSTASQEVLLGPFLDDTDGKTAETGLTIANTDIKIWKSGGTTEASKNSGGATHIAAGRYYAVLDATDTDTIGPLEINVHVSGALPVKKTCEVVDEAVYDVKFGTVALATATNITAATGVVLSTPGNEAVADATINRNIQGGSNTGRTVRQALAALRNKVVVSGGTMTVYATDDSASEWTASVNTTAGNPITTIDPA
jgi:hypothetical protein